MADDDYKNRSYGEIPVGFGMKPGIVVVDFSRVLAGPYATMMLGDFGADDGA